MAVPRLLSEGDSPVIPALAYTAAASNAVALISRAQNPVHPDEVPALLMSQAGVQASLAGAAATMHLAEQVAEALPLLRHLAGLNTAREVTGDDLPESLSALIETPDEEQPGGV